MPGKKPYSDAVSTGMYAKQTGLMGKYDNVRRLWEDELTRRFIRPYIKELIDRKAKGLERLRILDLGCGVGDGYDLLMSMTAKDVGIYDYAVDLISPEALGLYLGIDINPNLLANATELYSRNDKVLFKEGSFAKGLPEVGEAFDIYYTSYGTLSHNLDELNVKILADIAKHSGKNALVICDWLGRYSYEWQDLWVDPSAGETFMEYRISYIYPPEERHSAAIESFPLRLISKDEVQGIVDEASRLSGVEIKVRKLFDRSVFVGRHMETAEYNRNCTPLRTAVNSLLEPNLRTDLNTLVMDYVPKAGFSNINTFFDGFSTCWNTLVRHTLDSLSAFSEGGENRCLQEDIYTFYPEPLKEAVKTMAEVVCATGDLPGDSRANIIEPQLAYALRKLEMELQPGLGVGHGLVGVFEINK